MKTLNNAQYLAHHQGYELLCIDEIGFSHKKLALKHKLYESFGRGISSTYREILQHDLHGSSQLTQVWAFHQEVPIGLYIAVHFDDHPKVCGIETSNEACITGQIHLYTTPAHRKNGLAAQAIPYLEDSLNKTTLGQCAIVMEDNAYRFANCLTGSLALPSCAVNKQSNRVLLDQWTAPERRHGVKANYCF